MKLTAFPDFRMLRSSPTHKIAVIPAFDKLTAFAAISSDDSSLNIRLSECPMTTWLTKPWSIAVDTSPVNAPFSFGFTFCAPS